MRCNDVEGIYLQYKDSGKPVEVFDRVTYAFQSADRTCLVANPNHLALLLKTDRYQVVGVEVSRAELEAMLNAATADEPIRNDFAEIDAEVVTPKRRGRPPKGR